MLQLGLGSRGRARLQMAAPSSGARWRPGEGAAGMRQGAGGFPRVAEFLPAGRRARRNLGRGLQVGARRISYDSFGRRARPRGRAPLGHNFESFAASHITPGQLSRGRAMLARYAQNVETIEQRFGMPGQCWSRSGASSPATAATTAPIRPSAALATLTRLRLPPRRPLSRRADRRADAGRARRLPNPEVVHGAWASESARPSSCLRRS